MLVVFQESEVFLGSEEEALREMTFLDDRTYHLHKQDHANQRA